MFFSSQIKINSFWLVPLTLTTLLLAASCSLLEDTLNNRESKEPVNVTIASVCGDNSVSVSENIVLRPSVDALHSISQYFIEMQKQAKNGNLTPPVTVEQVRSPQIRQNIESLAQQAWSRALDIAAKDDFLKDKMETPYYEDLLFEMFMEASLQRKPLNCYQIHFTYRYSPFELGSDDDHIFTSRIFVHGRNNDISPSFCEIIDSIPKAYQETHLCLDDRKPDTGGGSGSFDDDD